MLITASNRNDDEQCRLYNSISLGKTTKLITSTNAITTISTASFIPLNEISTTSFTSITEQASESSVALYFTKNWCICRHRIEEKSKRFERDEQHFNGSVGLTMMMNRTMKNANANAKRVTINDVTNGHTMTTKCTCQNGSLKQSKSNIISRSSRQVHGIIKANDRSRVVLKDDIESIRERAFEFNHYLFYRRHNQRLVPFMCRTYLSRAKPKSSEMYSNDRNDVR